MAIYRGSGSAATTTDQATIDAVAEDAAAASTSASNAATSATAAASSASSASSSATSASSSASNASSSASSASTSATNAASSASAASTSATAAASSETSASGSATNAASEAAAALSSKALALDAQTAAETAESNASDHADDAVKAAYGAEDVLQTLSDSSTLYSARHYASKTGADKDAAAASATAAAASETAAANSATAAQAAEDAALAALDNFDDRYLGQKASDPTLDNDGNALVAGALYFNTTDNAMKVYDGSNWLAAYASLSGALIAANNLSDLQSASAARTNLGLGTAATTASTDYATAAQGALADSATQPGDNVSTLTNDSGYITDYTVTEGDVTAHQAALSITESQISDLGSYITGNQTITLSGDVSGSGTTSISVTVADDSHNHVISNVDGLQTALDAKQAASTALTTSTSFGGDVSGTYNAIVVADDSHNHIISNVDGLQTALDSKQASGTYLAQGGSITSGTVTTLTSTTANITTVDLGNWTVTESSGVLYFATGGTNKMKLDASGNLTVVGDVTAYGTV